MRMKSLLTLAGLLCFTTAAQAHITLEKREAKVGSFYRATFLVPHGCDGSPTVKIQVSIPDGVVGVKPMPKAGWQLDIVKGKYDKPYAMFHGSADQGVKEVTWSGKLPDEYYDEFVLMVYLSSDLSPNQTLYFPVVQECEQGVHHWIETPKAGSSESGHGHGEPAPALKLLPKQ